MSPTSTHIRGRQRNPVFNQPYLLPNLTRLPRHTTSRPRSLIHNPLALRSPTSYADPKKPNSFFLRLPTSSLIISSIALAFFIFGIVVSSTVSSILVSPRARDLPLSMAHDQSKATSSFSTFYPISNLTSPTLTNSVPSVRKFVTGQSNNSDQSHTPNITPPTLSTPRDSTPEALRPQQKSTQNKIPVEASSQNVNTTQASTSLIKSLHNDVFSHAPNSSSALDANPVPHDPMKGHVSWTRSWPISPELDETHLIPLAKALKFDNRTMLNYFHMHKTGGVTLKSEVMAVVNNPENKAKAARRGYGLRYIETCYEVQKDDADDSIEGSWHCDFDNVRKLTDDQLASVDIVMGHQYWSMGAEAMFSKYRHVRPFSIFRHPLPRKLSFFYHFFVRNLGRDEAKAGKDEVIKFLLGEEMPDDTGTRDAGPNYYASRMVSDGVSGFTGHRYELSTRQSDDAISNVASKLQNKYALVGLQIQHEASQCMLEKLIQVFAHARGIDDLVGTPKLSFHTAKLNSGGYPWTSEKIWKAMTAEQRKKYKQVERVDLAIYKRAVRRFKEDVKRFSCEDKVVDEAFHEDVFE